MLFWRHKTKQTIALKCSSEYAYFRHDIGVIHMGNRIMGYVAFTALAATLACKDAGRDQVYCKPGERQAMVEPPCRGRSPTSGNADSACGILTGEARDGIQCRAVLRDKTSVRELMTSSLVLETSSKELQFDEWPTKGAPVERAADGSDSSDPLCGWGEFILDRRVNLRKLLGSHGKLEALLRMRLWPGQDILLEPAGQQENGLVQVVTLLADGMHLVKIRLLPGQDVILEPVNGHGELPEFGVAWAYKASFSGFGDPLGSLY